MKQLATEKLTTTNSVAVNAQLLSVLHQKLQDKPHADSLLALVDSIHASTMHMVAKIQTIKDNSIRAFGGKDYRGQIIGFRDMDGFYEIMIGGGDSKNGMAYYLKREIARHTQFLNDATSLRFSFLAEDAKGNPMFTHDNKLRDKDFAHLHFENCTLGMGLLILTHYQSALVEMEGQALAKLAIQH